MHYVTYCQTVTSHSRYICIMLSYHNDVNYFQLVFVCWIQGNTDHAVGLQTKLGCNNAGQFPLYQAAMNLMEEVPVVKCLHTCCRALLVDVRLVS